MLKNKSAILLFFALIVIDQLSKFIIRQFDGFYICNTGIAFGFKIPIFIIGLFWLIIIFFIWKLYKSSGYSTIIKTAILLIIAGGISNLVDRFQFGCVIDFIDLYFWPIFNIADIFICLGAIMIIGKLFKNK